MRILVSIIVFNIVSLAAFSQEYDFSFRPVIKNAGSLSNGLVTNDGKMILTGYFNQYNDTKLYSLVRLNADGTVDETFNPAGTGPTIGVDGSGADVSDLVLLPDNKIMIVGQFNYYNGVEMNRLARLNSDGTLDESFASPPRSDVGGTANEVTVQPDGKILATSYEEIESEIVMTIVRYNTDGSIDNTFVGKYIDGTIFDIKVQPGGKILVGGLISSYGESEVAHIFRLNTDGTLDDTFEIGTGADDLVIDIAIRSDEKIIVAGWFASFNGFAKPGVVLLDSDGTVDESFTAEAEHIRSVIPEASGSMIVLESYLNTTIKRLDSDGSIEASIAADGNSAASSFLALNNGQFMTIGGHFEGTSNLTRFNEDLTVDHAFDSGVGPLSEPWMIHKVLPLPGGKIAITGYFSYYNGENKNGIVKLNADLTLDETFDIGTGFNDLNIITPTVQSDGKLIVQTEATEFNGTSLSSSVIRLNHDGSMDNSFLVDERVIPTYRLTVGKDDKLYSWAGRFRNLLFNGSVQYIIRLNADGTTDMTFTPEFDNHVLIALPLDNGKIMASGRFTTINGTPVPSTVRLNENGTLDASFVHPIDFESSTIDDIFKGEDGKLLICGTIFINGSGDPYSCVRLLENGDIDPEYVLTQNSSSLVFDGVLLNDNTLLASNLFEVKRFSKDGDLSKTSSIQFGSTDLDFAQSDATTVFVWQLVNPVTYYYEHDNIPVWIAKLKIAPLSDLAAPSYLEALVTTNENILLLWSESPNAVSYHIERSDGTGFVEIAERTFNVYFDEDAEAGVTYQYRVRARGLGGYSEYSNIDEATLALSPPTAPTFLTATVNDNGNIELNWNPANGNVTNYEIEMTTTSDFTKVGESVTTNLTLEGLDKNITYKFRVRAVGPGGESDYSNETEAFIEGDVPVTPAPATPTLLSAEPNSDTSIELNWSHSSQNITNFEIEMATTSDFAKVGEPTTTSFIAEDLAPNTSYRFRVRAVGPGGVSEYSNEASVQTPQTVVGLADEDRSVSVYPNPATDVVYVSGASEAVFIDAIGRTISSHAGEKISININNINPGVYFVRTKSVDGSSVHRVVKF